MDAHLEKLQDEGRLPADLRDELIVAIVDRDDAGAADPPDGWRTVRVHMPRIDVSSTEASLAPIAGGRITRACNMPGTVKSCM
jgi:hypothetical protein